MASDTATLTQQGSSLQAGAITARLGRLWRAGLTGPAVLVVAMSFNNAGIFGFHVIVSRILGPARYGGLGALLGLSWLFSVATSAITIAVVRRVAAHPELANWDTRRLARSIALIVIGLVIVGSASSVGVANFLHMGSIVPVLLLIVYGSVVLSQVVARGIVLGSHRYQRAAGAIAVGAVVRVALAPILASTGGTSGAITAYAAAEATTAVILLLAAHRRVVDRPRIPLDVPLQTLWLTVAAYGGIWLLSGSDQLWARHLLRPVDAGIYVAASTAGSIALWFPYNVTTSLFPKLVREATVTGGSRSFLVGAGAAALVAVAAASVMILAPGIIVSVLFGASYRHAAGVLVLLAVSNGLQGFTGFLLHHQLAHHRRTSTLPWTAVVSLAVLIEAHHHGAKAIALDAVTVSAVLALTMLAVSLSIARHTRPVREGSAARFDVAR